MLGKRDHKYWSEKITSLVSFGDTDAWNALADEIAIIDAEGQAKDKRIAELEELAEKSGDREWG